MYNKFKTCRKLNRINWFCYFLLTVCWRSLASTLLHWLEWLVDVWLQDKAKTGTLAPVIQQFGNSISEKGSLLCRRRRHRLPLSSFVWSFARSQSAEKILRQMMIFFFCYVHVAVIIVVVEQKIFLNISSPFGKTFSC